MRSNDTLVDASFQLISNFFHVNQGVLCSEHAGQASSKGVLEGATGLLNKGGGSNRLPGQQAVEFPQVLASNNQKSKPSLYPWSKNFPCQQYLC